MRVSIAPYTKWRSVELSVFADFGFPDDFVGLLRAVLGVKVAEVSAFVGIVDHIGQVDRVAHQPSGVHEVGGNLQTAEESHLNEGGSTTRGAMRFKVCVYSLGCSAMRK